MSNAFPQESDKSVRIAAVETLWPMIERWMKEQGEPTEKADKESVVSVLVKSRETCGYKLAKELESVMIFPDADLVDILDYIQIDIRKVLWEVWNAWVIENKWVPQFKVGDLVMFPLEKGKPVPGVIAGGHPEIGLYVIQTGDVANGSHGYIIPHTVVEKRP